MTNSKICSKCHEKFTLQYSSRYCRKCKNLYMRKWRKNHPLTSKQKIKANIRCHVKMKCKRGQIKKLPCEVCGSVEVHAHHDNYNEPFAIRWLCNYHHNEWHKNNSAIEPIC